MPTATRARKRSITPLSNAGADTVEAAISAGDPPAALLAALAWWREQRAPEVADLIDVLSTKVYAKGAMLQASWTALGCTKDSRVVVSLLAGLPFVQKSFTSRAAELLVGFPEDPRIAGRAGDLVMDPTDAASAHLPLHRKLVAYAARIRDTRQLAVFDARLRKRKPDASTFWVELYKAVAAAVETLRGVAPVRIDRKRVARLTAKAEALAQARIYLGDFGVAADPRPPGAAPARITSAPPPDEVVPVLAGSPLERALAHLVAGRVAPAIAAMVERWRDLRAPALADVIDRASRMLPSFDRPLSDPGDPAWYELYQREPDAAMPQLLLNLHSETIKQAELRIDALAKLPDDPRIALRLAQLTAGLLVSLEPSPYWISLFSLLARHADPRLVAPLAAHVAWVNPAKQAQKYLGDYLASTKPPVVSKVDAALIAKLDAAVAKLEPAHAAEAKLLDAIAADFEDDAPRLVYADWLQERAHPRGELLALAIKAKRSAAEAKRLKELERLPNIYGAFGEGVTRFDKPERGLFDVVAVPRNARVLQWRALASAPLARVVRTLMIDEPALPAREIEEMLPWLPNLTEIECSSGYGVPDGFILKGWKRSGQTFTRA